MWIVLIYTGAFFAGSLLPLNYVCHKNKVLKIRRSISNKDMLLLLFPLWFYGQLIVLKNRGSLFHGYTIEYNTEILGPLATLNTIFLFFYLYNRQNKKNSFFLLTSLIEFSIILMGFGNRMYIMIPIVALAVYMLDNSIVKYKSVLMSGGCMAFLFLIIGVLREGRSSVSFELLFYIGMAEPALTWISCISMLYLNSIPLFSFPRHFLSSFYNFIPSILFPGKDAYIQSLNLSYHTPFGATSIITSITSDFGVLGGCIALFLLGFLLTSIRINGKGLFGKTYYYCCCGIIPFQLFRDGFTVVNKMFIGNLLIIPAMIILINNVLYSITHKKC